MEQGKFATPLTSASTVLSPYLSTNETEPLASTKTKEQSMKRTIMLYAITHISLVSLDKPSTLFLLGTVFTQGQATLSRESRSQEDEPCPGACPPAAGTSRPALQGHGLEVLVELADLFAVVGIYLQCEPGSSTCPGSSIKYFKVCSKTTDTKQREM